MRYLLLVFPLVVACGGDKGTDSGATTTSTTSATTTTATSTTTTSTTSTSTTTTTSSGCAGVPDDLDIALWVEDAQGVCTTDCASPVRMVWRVENPCAVAIEVQSYSFGPCVVSRWWIDGAPGSLQVANGAGDVCGVSSGTSPVDIAPSEVIENRSRPQQLTTGDYTARTELYWENITNPTSPFTVVGDSGTVVAP